MARVARSSTAAVVTASLALLVGCTAGTTAPDPDDAPSVTASPTPEPPEVHTAELRLPDQPTSVVDVAEPDVRAAATSAAFYDSAPVAVVAPLEDPAAQARAASAAVALGAPLLLAAGSTDPGEPTADELDRLGVLAVVTVGDVSLDLGEEVAVVEAPSDDAALADLLRVELTPVAPPAAGAELASVIALDRATPVLPSAAVPAPTGDSVPTDPAAPADPGAPSEPEGSPLPLTELPEPVSGGLLLTAGDPGDLAAVATARSAGVPVLAVPSGDPRADTATVQAFAAARPTHVVGLGAVFGPVEGLAWKAATATTGVELPGGGQLVFPGRRFVALYGTPTYPALGLLGEQDAAASIARAQGLSAEYQTLTTDTVVPAFEMIVTVASAGAGPDGNYSNELPIETFVPWIEAAQAAGVYVVLDLQPGRTDFVTQARLYERLLLYPNVGLALDPEWRLLPDQVHLRQIGSVHADEVNAVAAYLAQLTRDNHLPQKLLVLHQFMHRMIQARETVVTSHPELAVLIHADGQGSQGAKAGTWASLHEGAPAGVAWGWKNFVDEDVPMLTPVQTYDVVPVPQFVSYQ
ncbi:MAG: hypothetical protein JWP95_463 [Actinotalea sp.]|nr:hypothetical protein [Actinotalea sp.]